MSSGDVIRRLAAQFLGEYSERLGADGCNDWTWPEWVKPEVRRAIMDRHPDSAVCHDLVANAHDDSQMNWIVVDAVAAALREGQPK